MWHASPSKLPKKREQIWGLQSKYAQVPCGCGSHLDPVSGYEKEPQAKSGESVNGAKPQKASVKLDTLVEWHKEEKGKHTTSKK